MSNIAAQVFDFLESLESLLEEPVSKEFCNYLKLKIPFLPLQDISDLIHEDNERLKVPEVINNSFRKKYMKDFILLLQRYFSYVIKNETQPFSLNQAMVNASYIMMDYHKIEEILGFSKEWI